MGVDLIRRLRRRRRASPPTPALADDDTLSALGGCFDPARADSAVLAEMADARVDLSRPLLLRHHLWLPDEAAVREARRIAAEDGYLLRAEPAADGFAARASRPQQLTGLAVAQERSRMASLAQRLGGHATGWDALG